MRSRVVVLAAAATFVVAACGGGGGGGGGGAATSAATTCTVGVSWNNYQEERWAKWDEPAIKAAIAAGGGKYISNDAKSSAETQASNVDNLISQGAKVLIILAQDGTAIKPAVAKAVQNSVPVIAYDRLIENQKALYITFDNVLVGKLQAQGLAGKVPVSGQDGDKAALNRVALGTQTVDVWKDARQLGKSAGDSAMQLCKNTDPSKVSGTAAFKTPGGNTLSSILLTPDPITKDNLNKVLDAGWITKADLCQGVGAGKVSACG